MTEDRCSGKNRFQGVAWRRGSVIDSTVQISICVQKETGFAHRNAAVCIILRCLSKRCYRKCNSCHNSILPRGSRPKLGSCLRIAENMFRRASVAMRILRRAMSDCDIRAARHCKARFWQTIRTRFAAAAIFVSMPNGSLTQEMRRCGVRCCAPQPCTDGRLFSGAYCVRTEKS